MVPSYRRPQKRTCCLKCQVASKSPQGASMKNLELSRRNLAKLGLGAAAAGLASWRGLNIVPSARAEDMSDADSPFSDHASFAASFNAAYSFLDTMMDAYATGQTRRLIQSYSDQIGLESTAFVYDNAVA